MHALDCYYCNGTGHLSSEIMLGLFVGDSWLNETYETYKLFFMRLVEIVAQKRSEKNFKI